MNYQSLKKDIQISHHQLVLLSHSCKISLVLKMETFFRLSVKINIQH